jgi:DNA polymerase I
LYGMGPVSLAESLSISRKEASLFIAEYFKQFPKVKKYLEEMKQKALERGFVETLFGRRRYFPNMESMGWQARREAERMAINAPIQGSGADIIKMAIVKIGQDLKEYFERDDVRLLLQVHDELLFEVKPKLRQELSLRIQNIMEQVCKLEVDLTVGVKHGSDWYSLV